MSAKKTTKTKAEAPKAKKAPKADAAKAEQVQAPPPVKAKDQRKTKAKAEPKTKKLSALDAAAKVLGERGQAMTCQELIEAMATKGYWTSPNGKTPAQTLYAAILRETNVKGDQARFTKTERGKFARNGAA